MEKRLAQRINQLIPSFSLWPSLVDELNPEESDEAQIRPLLMPCEKLELKRRLELIQERTDNLGSNLDPEFAWSSSFDPEFIRSLWFHGWLTITTPLTPEFYLLLPKLHQERCVMFLSSELKVPRTVRKKFKHYKLTINQKFSNVIDKIVEQHGSNWLCPQLIDSFHKIMLNQSKTTKPVNLFSMELSINDELVAGDLGYSIGTCFTSLTGFSKKGEDRKNHGTIHLYALREYLIKTGFTLWDLGMSIDYKQEMGAQTLPRIEFLQILTSLQNGQDLSQKLIQNQSKFANCKEIYNFERIVKVMKPSKTSKTTQKYRSKVQRREMYSTTRVSGVDGEEKAEGLDLSVPTLIHELLHELLWKSAFPVLKTVFTQKEVDSFKLQATFHSILFNSRSFKTIYKNLDYYTSFFCKLLKYPNETHKIIQTFRNSPEIELISFKHGFLNVKLSNQLYELYTTNLSPESLLQDSSRTERVILDYCGPNFAKRLHIGHIRSSSFGDFARRSLTTLYPNMCVQSISHAGDFGQQFGRIVNYMKSNEDEENVVRFSKSSDLFEKMSSLSKIYQVCSIKPKTTEDERVHRMIQDFRGPDAVIWQSIVDTSKLYVDTVFYQMLNILPLEHVPESFYIRENIISQVLKSLQVSQLLKMSQSSKCISIEYKNKDKVIQRNDGTATYALFDLAAIYTRLKTSANITYFSDTSQTSHFQFIFHVAKKAKWTKQNTILKHVPFGIVLSESGSKLRSRESGSYDLVAFLETEDTSDVKFNEQCRKRSKDIKFNSAFLSKKKVRRCENMNGKKFEYIALCSWIRVLKIASLECKPSLLAHFLLKLRRYMRKGEDSGIIEFIFRRSEHILGLRSSYFYD